MQSRVTIRDVAKAAGVSAATVDRVLNGRNSVRKSTAIHVLDVARKMGFHAVPLLEQRVIGAPDTLTFGLVLLPTEKEFYQHFRQIAEETAAAETRMKLRLITEFAASSSPLDAVAALERLAPRVQAIGMVAVDHPRVTEAVSDLRARGIPVFAVMSDFAQGVREAYVGTNNLKVGRSAAWMLARGVPRDAGGELAVFVGGHLWHGHDLREAGFRSYIRRERPDLTLLDAQVNLDTEDLTYEATVAIMTRYRNLRGIYCCGGGRLGVIRAVRDEGRIGKVDVVANELTDSTRRAFSDGIVSMVIDTPVRGICEAMFGHALHAVKKGLGESPGQIFVPMTLVLPESC